MVVVKTLEDFCKAVAEGKQLYIKNASGYIHSNNWVEYNPKGEYVVSLVANKFGYKEQ